MIYRHKVLCVIAASLLGACAAGVGLAAAREWGVLERAEASALVIARVRIDRPSPQSMVFMNRANQSEVFLDAQVLDLYRAAVPIPRGPLLMGCFILEADRATSPILKKVGSTAVVFLTLGPGWWAPVDGGFLDDNETTQIKINQLVVSHDNLARAEPAVVSTPEQEALVRRLLQDVRDRSVDEWRRQIGAIRAAGAGVVTALIAALSDRHQIRCGLIPIQGGYEMFWQQPRVVADVASYVLQEMAGENFFNSHDGIRAGCFDAEERAWRIYAQYAARRPGR